MAQLLAGPEARAAAQALATESPYLTALAHPTSADRNQPIELLALAHPGRALLIDAGRTPELTAFFGPCPLLGALHAQPLAHQLLATFGSLPKRFACANIAHSLITADVTPTLSLPELQHLYGAPSPTEPAPTGPSALAAFAREARATAQLLARQGEQLRLLGLTQVSRIEAAAVSPIVSMEHHGMPVDRARLLTRLQEEAHRMAQLRAVLGTTLQAPLPDDASDDQLLAAVRGQNHPLASLSEANIAKLPPHIARPLAELNTLRRLSRTVGLRFADHIAADGRIRSHFIQIGARSGRMSCTKPNLQAITSDASRRACFRAPPGHTLIMGDYAACELRILADMSGDAALSSAIVQGTDLHASIASRMFGTAVSKSLRPELRAAAKTIAFGLIYGMGTQALAAALDCDQPAAEGLMRQFFAAFPEVQGHLEAQSDQALRAGYATTCSGRRCVLDAHTSGRDRQGLRRMARNLPIQGTSADITKVALARIHQALENTPNRALVHCIHDEIILAAPTAEAPEAAVQLREAMEGAGVGLLRHIPLVADVRTGPDWQGH